MVDFREELTGYGFEGVGVCGALDGDVHSEEEDAAVVGGLRGAADDAEEGGEIGGGVVIVVDVVVVVEGGDADEGDVGVADPVL